jgi:Protein of unknown function (DUF3987)
VTTTDTALCGYGQPIEPGAERCGSCEYAGTGPAPCRFPRQAANGHERHDAEHQADKPDCTDDADWDDLMARREPGHPPGVPDWPEDDEPEGELPEAPPFPHDLARGPLRALLDWADEDGLPVSFVAATAETVAAAACARTVTGEPGASLPLGGSRTVIPVLWQALIGESGTGKNPSMRPALAPTDAVQADRLDVWRAECEAERDAAEAGERKPDEPERPENLTMTSATTEAIARWLAGSGGAGLLRNGELASFLRSFGQYKGGAGSDRYDLMDVWSGEPIDIARVGDGGQKIGIRIRVDQPRLSVIGGLVPENVALLGNESDGLRARFLPVLPSSEVRPNLDGSKPLPESWLTAVTRLHECDQPREWFLRGQAREVIKIAAGRWADRARNGTDPKVIRTALAKADEQAMRLALVMAELAEPGAGGGIPPWCAEYAVARVEYALGVWLALGTDQVMVYSRRDEVLSRGVRELLTRIQQRQPDPESRRRYMTRADIQAAKVAGAVRPDQVNELIGAWLAQFPRCVTVYSERDKGKWPRAVLADRAACPAKSSRGPAPVVVWEPRRTAQTLPRTDGKLLNSGVSVAGTDEGEHQESPGGGHSRATLACPETPESGPFRSFDSGVSGPGWPASETGPCSRCGQPCHRYGPGSRTLCDTCQGRPTPANMPQRRGPS